MSSSHRPHHLRRHLRAAALVAALAITMVAAPAADVHAHNTVTFDEAGDSAPRIGLVGDSVLAGVRWWSSYGDLRRYNFVLDAESCRRTVEDSCWSREDFRPDNTVLALQRLAGQWGELLVVMSGYNDSDYVFDEAVDAVVAEAREQSIPRVMWLTLRTDGVTYQDPQERASADGYRGANRVLYEKAAALDGYLQVADWATHAAGRDDWFEYDGVHLNTDGVSALTTFIAEHVDAVLAGHSLNPDVIPWARVGPGDRGPTVANVQRALLSAGISTVGPADGRYGEQTADAVSEFQRSHGLPMTGTVDEPTAALLGVRASPARAATAEPADVPDVRSPAPDGPARTAVAATTTVEVPSSRIGALAVILGAAAAVWLVRHRRTRRAEDEPPVPSGRLVDPPPSVWPVATRPYDYEDEALPVT